MARTESDDIDLMELLANWFHILRKNLLLAIVVPLAGVIGGVIYHTSTSDVWESSIMMETSLMSVQEAEFLFDQLRNVKPLPGLTLDQQKKVRKLTFKVVPEHSQISSLNEQSIYFKITARVVTKEMFPILEKALLDIVNAAPPVVRHRTERQLYYNEVIKRIETEIGAMEEVKSNVSGKTQATFLNPSQLYAQTVELFREKMSLEIRKKEIESVHLVKQFDTLSFEGKPSLPVLIILGFVLGVVMLSIAIFLRQFYEYVNRETTV